MKRLEGGGVGGGGGAVGVGASTEEVWMSVSCHKTWEELPALIRVSEGHKEQRRFFCVREKSQSAGQVQASIGGTDRGRG